MSSKSSSGKVPTGTIWLDKANSARPGPANQGIEPNPEVAGLLADVAANVDLTRASWTRASWTRASWTRASWTRASWTRATWTCAGCGGR
jgi:hypothetical protein